MLIFSLLLKEEDPSIKSINKDLPIEMNQIFNKDLMNSITLVQYIKSEHLPVREFTEMGR